MMEMVSTLESIGKGVFLVLVNTSLQVTLLIFLVWFMIRIFRPRSAVARYYLWFLAIFGILALPLFSAFLPGISIPMMRSAETAISPIYAQDIAVGGLTVAADMPGEAFSETDLETTQKRGLWTSAFRLLRQFGLISIIVLAWFVIALSMLFRLMGSYVWLRRFKKKSQRVVEGPALEIISRLRERMSITSGIHVFMSSDIHSPTSFGLFSTTIVLPESLADSKNEELEMVLSHEMAHAKRHDFLVNLFQRILQSVLFFHPLFHIANRRLAREREHICDDWVIQATGKRDDYAECLVGLVENAYYPRSISVAMMGHQHNISRRVDMIIDNSRGIVTRISRKAGISVFLMGCILLPMLATTQLVYTVEPKEPMGPVPGILDTEERFDISDEGEAEKTMEQEKKVKVAGIPDLNLGAAIRKAIGKPDGAITAADLQSITELEAPDNNISDITGIERCVNLERLVLGTVWRGWEVAWRNSNEIEDISPLKGLTRLVYLNLNGNEKISDIGSLSDLTNLTELFLNYNQISDVTPLSRLTSLTDLHLRNNQISDVAPLANLTNLVTLALGDNQVSDVTPLSNLTNLEELRFWKNQVSDVTPLSGLTNLTILYLQYNPIDDLTPLSKLANLISLHLSWTGIVNDDLTFLTNLTNLTQLALSGNQISDITPLSNLTNLTLVRLGETQISDVTPLANLTNLTSLELWKNQISDITLLSDFTSLTKLHLWGNQISDVTPLSNLTNLTELHLYNNQISDITPLSNLTNLAELLIHDNQIGDITPLSNLTNLTELWLQNNQIIDPSFLSNLAKLDKLMLAGNQIVDITSLVENSGFGKGSGIELSGNPLNDAAYSVHIPELRGRGVVVQTPFVDPNLEAVVREAIGKPEGAITEDDLQSITQLEARDNNISDIAGIEKCVNLEKLMLGAKDREESSNEIEDISPLNELTKLVELSLASNKVSSIEPLSGLTNLTKLNLNNNQITDAAPLAKLTNLWVLRLAENPISDVRFLPSLTNLDGLSIWDLPADDIDGVLQMLSDLPNLTRLSMGRCSITDLTPLSKLTGLISLELWNNQIGDLSPLSDLTELYWLHLAGNQISDITPLAGLTNLSLLYLNGNQVTDITPVSGLAKLGYLNLTNNPIADIKPLADLTNLRELYLSEVQVSDITPLANLTNLTWLSIYGNEISDLEPLANLTNVTMLVLHDNQISDIKPLSGLTSVDTLWLRENQIQDISPLSGLNNLLKLRLEDNQISDITPLAGLTKLFRLWIGGNKVSNIAPLSGLTELVILGLEPNPLNDEARNVHIPALQERGIHFELHFELYDPKP